MPSQPIRLGDLLVRHGVLTITQRDQVLAAQRLRGGPFGAIAEEMYGISAKAIERAWAEQYAHYTHMIDPRGREILPAALAIVERRQAWQFRVLPLEIGDDSVVCCTTQEHLPRALKFTGWRLGHNVHFLLAEPTPLAEAMMRHFPIGGMGPAIFAPRGAAAHR